MEKGWRSHQWCWEERDVWDTEMMESMLMTPVFGPLGQDECWIRFLTRAHQREDCFWRKLMQSMFYPFCAWFPVETSNSNIKEAIFFAQIQYRAIWTWRSLAYTWWSDCGWSCLDRGHTEDEDLEGSCKKPCISRPSGREELAERIEKKQGKSHLGKLERLWCHRNKKGVPPPILWIFL